MQFFTHKTNVTKTVYVHSLTMQLLGPSLFLPDWKVQQVYEIWTNETSALSLL